jgi:hypothetical protein
MFRFLIGVIGIVTLLLEVSVAFWIAPSLYQSVSLFGISKDFWHFHLLDLEAQSVAGIPQHSPVSTSVSCHMIPICHVDVAFGGYFPGGRLRHLEADRCLLPSSWLWT